MAYILSIEKAKAFASSNGFPPHAKIFGSYESLLDDSDIQEFYLGLGAEGERSFRDVKHYKRRKRWLS